MNISNSKHAYDKDFYAWVKHNVELLRQGKLSEIDAAHVAEELEDVGKRDRRELINRLSQLIAYLLKRQLQPERRGNSWSLTIKEQRIEIADLLEESPSLKHEIELSLNSAYKKAKIMAAKQMRINESNFPEICPFSLKKCLDEKFLPK